MHNKGPQKIKTGFSIFLNFEIHTLLIVCRGSRLFTALYSLSPCLLFRIALISYRLNRMIDSCCIT